MNLFIKYAYSIAIIFSFASTAYAMRCKVCNSYGKPDCDNTLRAAERYDFDCDSHERVKPYNKLILGTNRNATGCLKLKFETLDDNLEFTHRLCFWGDTTNVVDHCLNVSYLMLPLRQLSCDICTSDLCNSSTTTAATFAATLALMFFVGQIMSLFVWQRLQ